jgi:glycosyltransferase involved in cell wall biosynthesis
MTDTTLQKRPESAEQNVGDYGDYVVVTPAFNEQEHIQETIASIARQLVRPSLWVIVDDGSSDRTWDIINSAAEAYPWIKGHRRQRKLSEQQDGLIEASEMAAFLEGLDVALSSFERPEFIVKLDADLKLSPDYFASLFEEFAANPKLGIAGGVIYEYRGDDLVREKVSTAHVRGATKVYRRSCYENLHGLDAFFGWDVIDEMLARASGWDVRSFEHISLVHLRRTASRSGRFAGWARNGYMAYYIGMSPLRMLVRASFRLLFAGDIVQAAGLAAGYFANFLKRGHKLPNPELRKLVRRYQWVTARTALNGQKPNV